MAEHFKLIPFIKKWEGGFVNDPADLGGATNKGITLKTYQVYCTKRGLSKATPESLKVMPDKHWIEIFKSMYWDRWRADEIYSQSIANILVDWVWASGVHGIKRVQNKIGVLPDGIVGTKTLTAINAEDPEVLFKVLKKARTDFIEEICHKRPANLKFRKGWLNRINDLKFEK